MAAHSYAVTPVARPSTLAVSALAAPVRVEGKFLTVSGRKFYIKGVTYGTFRPDAQGHPFPDADTVESDFASMAASGLNAVRIYTPPPVWLLDAAQRHGLYVMVGLPWEQHIAFLDTPGLASTIEARMSATVRQLRSHPAVLAYVIGNEIPASIVRWHGARRIEKFLWRLYRAVKSEAPETLATYVSFPTTEYLQLPFVDFCCFNVYLERREQLESYLAQLHNVAGDRPLVMTEVGLDSRRNGEIVQAETLAWQVRSVFQGGCSGTFLFAWTDEWHRGGFEIEDWDFGLTRRNRQPKPALAAVRSAFKEIPFPAEVNWPRISVVVCTYNGSRTIRDTLNGLRRLDYPDYEVIVIDDGSTDETAEIAAGYTVRQIRTANRGLGAARNTGMKAATGTIIAYIDDDAYPDPHWLQYLAWTFLNTEYAGVGGPNIPPPGDGPIAECVAHAPGGPVHVLLSAQEAEHIPGCNFAFRRECLRAVGGFDPVFRSAGDDVDVCWRLTERGWKLGFQPAAVVWHHRRNSVRAYWRQQKGYGKAEALLERKWPSKYNPAGHVTWAGRLYGRGITRSLGRNRIYQGTWGAALFQRMYEPVPGTVAWLPLIPEWYLVILALLALVASQVLWPPLKYASISLAMALAVQLSYAVKTAVREFNGMRWPYRLLAMGLHLLQPVARLMGRINHGLTPWRHRGLNSRANPLPRVVQLWSEQWHSAEEWVHRLEKALSKQFAITKRGGEFDRWDLEIRGGLLGGMHTRLAVEEHGRGKQLLRLLAWPIFSLTGLGIACMFAILAAIAGFKHDWPAAVLLAGLASVPTGWSLLGCAHAKAAFESAVLDLGAQVLGREAVSSSEAVSEESAPTDAASCGAGDVH